ncbi:HTR-like protein [Halorubrum sp. JWXQ-INN 858]|uniref:sensor histidine kinase n=1 Tax=Halorubrum sp. JWXQ-INN 858 TaxID=2690782 RepID=UPI0013587CFD|nr:histidine kinase N-terminal 7TM domain-containing protein [Halorubrum sp. JWXQ-INN 858]MWV65952.1 HTR-like protein [Halorubrum sp. JWXQ-INN 858]
MSGALGAGIVFASLGASFGALYLLQYLYHQRERSGASWFMGNIASVAAFCGSYGIALLVFEPTLRVALGAVAFVSVCFMGPFFLAFGLDYTGRGDLIRTPLFGIVAVVPLLTVVLAVTNPVHGLVWRDFQFDPVFGLATVVYTVQPWGVFAVLFSIGTAAVGSLLLIGAILSYGPLYRREAIAVILSTVPPSVGVFVWLFELGPVPQLHLTAPLMLVHVSLDAYAFVGTHMFQTNPATQRTAERTGLDSLSDPVLVLDTEQQIVRVNDRAEELFPSTLSNALPIALGTVLGVGLETLRETEEIRVETERGGTFAVSYTALTDPRDTPVGSMLVLYDVTEDRQREQQLAVLNRVLRHNLRNETTVISGYADLLGGDVDDLQRATRAGKIEAASDRLLSIAEKVGTFESVQERERQPAPLAVSTVLADVERSCSAAHSDATIEWTVTPPELRLRTDPVLLSVLLDNLVENAIIHSEVPEQTASISVSDASNADGGVVFEIRDRNERIPEIEIETLRAGDETPLQHGQGIGLWIVYWCVQKLRGSIDFEYDDGNVLTVTLPNLT